MKNQEEGQGQQEGLDRKLRSMPDEELKQLAGLWSKIYQADPGNKQKRISWVYLKRESARRGLRV